MNPLYMQQPNLMQSFQQFQRTFKGDANQQIQQLMQSGKINQMQYNRAVQMANQFRGMFAGMFGR